MGEIADLIQIMKCIGSVILMIITIKCDKILLHKKCMKMRGETMNDKAKKARAAYAREWRAKNKDKVSAAHERYWEKKAREAEKTAAIESEKAES